jgi:aconitate decarboxylase
MSDAIEDFAKFVAGTEFGDIPEPARAAAKTFILDSLGVGLIGSAGLWVAELIETQALWGRGDDARVWGRETRLPTPAAAMCNAYQMHNSEFDCVHEGAVAHALSVTLPCALAEADRQGAVENHPVTGADLMTAVILGVDVVCNLGLAATSGLRFFRPGTAGLFGGVTAIAKLRGFDRNTLVRAYSIAYAQLCGTMQPHSEGSMLLGMQMGFSARNAIVACDMAQAGLAGLKNVLEGPFGYYAVIEAGGDLTEVVAQMGKIWRITEMAHKPHPSGRATHGVVDAALKLRADHGLNPAAIESATLALPPMTHHLVSRPVHDAMEVNYARLCSPYVAALALANGEIQIKDFDAEALRNPEILALAQRIAIERTDHPDPNALTPVEVTVTATDGRILRQRVDIVLGNPENPLTREAHLAKFRHNAAGTATPLPEGQIEALIQQVDGLETVGDARNIIDNLNASP